jgi:hypothetical protein
VVSKTTWFHLLLIFLLNKLPKQYSVLSQNDMVMVSLWPTKVENLMQ